jgi:hypothetical protein
MSAKRGFTNHTREVPNNYRTTIQGTSRVVKREKTPSCREAVQLQRRRS